MYEKLLYNQLYSYVDNILSPNQSGFRNGDSAQQCLLVMIEKFKESIDKGVHLTDLQKAFDCIDDLQCFRFCLKRDACALRGRLYQNKHCGYRHFLRKHSPRKILTSAVCMVVAIKEQGIAS